MKPWLAAAMILAAGSSVATEGWVRLGAADLTAALQGTALSYDDGTRQSFRADGGTTFWSRSGAQSQGRWAVRGDRYCSVWPPSDNWACYDVDRSADQSMLRFRDDAGAPSVGRFTTE